MRCYGKVQTVAESPRSYMVVTETGLLHRNRRQLIKVGEGTEEGKIGRQTTTVNKRGTVQISGSSKQNERAEHQERCYEAGNHEDDTCPAGERGRISLLKICHFWDSQQGNVREV
ncbi:hypothetical protein PR048_015600 [Dryococelus australis]|uniref:Uncharacterized protein n=1 Tax=Dryococelus australis TaxID=614101 RepID=A0ABQ9HHX7_9NEOP|nr:hypothetical protein PR048_015600 [Dryococelus australis]